jgi:hypothetical protein
MKNPVIYVKNLIIMLFLKIEISSNGQNCSILSQKVPNVNCISIMMSFLTYITGIFMNFERLPILTDYAN